MKYVTMGPVFVAVISLLSASLITPSGAESDADAYLSRFIADLWLEGADVVKIIWRDCSKKLVDVKDVIDHKEYFPKFVRCMKRKTLRAMDRALSPDVVPVADGVNLVRFELVDHKGNVMPENETSTWTEKELEEGEWRSLALQRMARILRTHVIKFDIDGDKGIEKAEYRGRRRHQMMTMMMFGVVSIGMVMIPMGFQFLAVLGGKALLLAKMALILASIQGLKKIAASPLNYGFYHYPPYDHYDRRGRDDWPLPSVMPATPPPAMSVDPWYNTDEKLDRIHIAATEGAAETQKVEVTTWRPELSQAVRVKPEPRLYPVYAGPVDTQIPIFTAIDAPTPLTDLTTRPGNVLAEYALELPFNNFRFQSPTTVVSA